MKGKWNKGHEMLPTNGEHMEIVINLSGYCEKDKNGQIYFFVDGRDEGCGVSDTPLPIDNVTNIKQWRFDI